MRKLRAEQFGTSNRVPESVEEAALAPVAAWTWRQRRSMSNRAMK
jgi:hypothetical protein